jgi:sugar O-acyltransferase (sialic acid O-acetyltransferase NeuD family)
LSIRKEFALKEVILVGAGGLGREVMQYVLDTVDPKTHRIKGFLDDFKDRLKPDSLDSPVLGTTTEYHLTEADWFLLAIGDPHQRMKIAERLTARGARFLTLVHPLAHVARTARLGEGCIVGPFATVGAYAQLGNHVALTYYASVGHDARVGDCCALSPYAAANGGTILEPCVFVGTHAAINPMKRIGRGAKVAAGAVVYRNVPAHSLAAGNPAKIWPILKADMTSEETDTS